MTTAEGPLVGLQRIGPTRGEARLLSITKWVEGALGGPNGAIDPIERARYPRTASRMSP